MASIQTLLEKNSAQLAAVSDSPRLEAELLLAHALAVTRTALRAWPAREVDEEAQARFDALIARRMQGEPIAYILGEREFWSLSLRVTPDTLIPRPETELLVESALSVIPRDAAWRIADLGTGSGAIALAIARERPRCQVVASDVSTAALAVARDNAARLQITNVEFRLGDWYDALMNERMHVIVSNPPYVAHDDPHMAQGDLRFEPRGALTAGDDEFAALKRLIAGAAQHLQAPAWLWLEHGYNQGAAVRALFVAQHARDVRTLQDLEGRDRVSGGMFNVL